MIGLGIANILENYSDLTDIVGTKIFPILAKQRTSLPLVEYTIDTLTPEYTKTEWIGDDVDFSILCTALSYKLTTELAGEVRNAMELEAGAKNGITMQKVYMDGYTEDYDLDGSSYIINLRFRTRVIAYS